MCRHIIYTDNLTASMKMLVPDIQAFLFRQTMVALTCPINRHGTRVEHNCDDWALWYHPEYLINHFVENGGAAAFAARRAEFLKEVFVPDEIEYNI
ncbi:MAG: hypothetical protein WC648_00835 [Candidatus Paceibacterota bacterium]